MLLFILSALIVSPKCVVVAADDVMIPYLDDDTLGISINDLDEDDEDMLPPCDLTNPDPKLVEWRLLSNSHQVFLDLDNWSPKCGCCQTDSGIHEDKQVLSTVKVTEQLAYRSSRYLKKCEKSKVCCIKCASVI